MRDEIASNTARGRQRRVFKRNRGEPRALDRAERNDRYSVRCQFDEPEIRLNTGYVESTGTRLTCANADGVTPRKQHERFVRIVVALCRCGARRFHDERDGAEFV